MTEFQFRTEPFEHQDRVWRESRSLESFAVLWEQGTGKSKLAIDTFAWNCCTGLVDTLLVVAPPGVDLNWITDEIPAHLPSSVADRLCSVHYKSKKASTKWHQSELARALHHRGVTVVAMSYPGFMSKRGKEYAKKILTKRAVMMVCDESHSIKTPGAKTTKTIIAAGRHAKIRRAMTGTPVSNGPFDIYSQLRFIDPEFWKRRDIHTFAEFKMQYGIWERNYNRAQGREYDSLIDYRNLDELYTALSEASSRVTKDDVLDLPPKLYSRRYFEMTPEQERAYQQMRDDALVELRQSQPCVRCGGTGEIEYENCVEMCETCSGAGQVRHWVEAELAIVQLLRLQQITCGYLPSGEEDELVPLGDRNPRLDVLEDVLDGLGHQAIVWARFRGDIDSIMERLGDRAVRYDGAMSDEDAARSKEAFRAGEAQFFVGNPAKGATGLTLTEAKTVVYYNNSFKLIDRQQSEDRAHRIGQDTAVNYVDIMAPGTVDEKIASALRDKLDVASKITGDRLREWL